MSQIRFPQMVYGVCNNERGYCNTYCKGSSTTYGRPQLAGLQEDDLIFVCYFHIIHLYKLTMNQTKYLVPLLWTSNNPKKSIYVPKSIGHFSPLMVPLAVCPLNTSYWRAAETVVTKSYQWNANFLVEIRLKMCTWTVFRWSSPFKIRTHISLEKSVWDDFSWTPFKNKLVLKYNSQDFAQTQENFAGLHDCETFRNSDFVLAHSQRKVCLAKL